MSKRNLGSLAIVLGLAGSLWACGNNKDDTFGDAGLGGATGTGGKTATGGRTTTGGSRPTGGSSTTGGSKATGGATVAAGGTTAAAGGTTVAAGGTTAAAGGTTAAAGGTTAEVGGTTAAAGGTTAAAGGTTAAAGGTTAEVGGTTAAAGGTTAEVGGTTAAIGGDTSAGGDTSTSVDAGDDAGTGGSSSLTMEEACPLICDLVTGTGGLTCQSNPLELATCNSDCPAYANDSSNGDTLVAEYRAMISCFGQTLTQASDYVCAASPGANVWSTIDGTACEAVTCTWACDETNNGNIGLADTAVYDRCHTADPDNCP